jgi:hypothetical protein
VGERRATVGQVLPTWVTMRDYNPFRVRLAWVLVKADGPPQGRTGGKYGRERIQTISRPFHDRRCWIVVGTIRAPVPIVEPVGLKVAFLYIVIEMGCRLTCLRCTISVRLVCLSRCQSLAVNEDLTQ